MPTKSHSLQGKLDGLQPSFRAGGEGTGASEVDASTLGAASTATGDAMGLLFDTSFESSAGRGGCWSVTVWESKSTGKRLLSKADAPF